MLKPQPYNFEDIVFQLELNLQSIRRELIQLLEESSPECLSCSRLRCRCQPLSSADSGLSDDRGLSDVRSPPPYTLPHPSPWKQDFITAIDSWIKASSDFTFKRSRRLLSKNDLNYFSLMWPPLDKSVWNYRIGREAEKKSVYKSERENSVDEFFGYFSKQKSSKNKPFYL